MQGQPNLNCKQMEEALDAFYDLELSAEEAEAVELHLADCEACTKKLAEINVLVTQLKNLPAVEWSGDLSDAIEARILAQASSPESKLESKVENIVSIYTGSNSLSSSQSSSPSSSRSQSVARSSKVAGFIQPRYILASAASILALFFAYSQFASTTTNVVTKVALPVSETSPVVKKVVPNLEVDSVRQVASTPKVVTVKVASKPDLQSQPKAAQAEITQENITKEKTATEKMLANNVQGDRDHNNNNVNDSEEIVAVYDYDTIDSVSDFGISTNEDGLYAIKL